MNKLFERMLKELQYITDILEEEIKNKPEEIAILKAEQDFDYIIEAIYHLEQSEYYFNLINDEFKGEVNEKV